MDKRTPKDPVYILDELLNVTDDVVKENLNRVVIGSGSIANEMAHGLEKMSRTLYSVANRTHEKAVDFVKKV